MVEVAVVVLPVGAQVLVLETIRLLVVILEEEQQEEVILGSHNKSLKLFL